MPASICSRKHLVALVIVFGWTTGAAAGQTSAAGALADAFVDAWNTHDVREFGRLYANDADWVTVGGDRHKGRVAVEGVLAKEHAGWARTTMLRATDVAVRAIDSENAIVMFKWEITRPKESAVTPVRGNTLLVAAKQDGRWIITAGQAAAVPLPK
jgi:uncharacterized protein (TIGR02246 family)